MFWEGFRSRDYGEHEFTNPKDRSISNVGLQTVALCATCVSTHLTTVFETLKFGWFGGSFSRCVLKLNDTPLSKSV